jgi:hypothetical protein
VTARTVVAFATPVHGAMVCTEFAQSLFTSAELLRRAGIGSTWLTIPGSSARKGRNTLLAAFLAEPALSHLLWVDADVSFPPDAPLRLLRHELPVVAGACPLKRPTETYALRFAEDADGGTRFAAATVAEVDRIGLAFVLLRRDALLRMVEAYPERHLHGETDGGALPEALRPWLYDLHPEELTASGRIEGEDYGWCRLWRQLGGEIWCDLSIRLAHHARDPACRRPAGLFRTAVRAPAAPRDGVMVDVVLTLTAAALCAWVSSRLGR